MSTPLQGPARPGTNMPIGGNHPTVGFGTPAAQTTFVPPGAPMPQDSAVVGGLPPGAPRSTQFGQPQFYGAGYDASMIPPAPQPQGQQVGFFPQQQFQQGPQYSQQPQQQAQNVQQWVQPPQQVQHPQQQQATFPQQAPQQQQQQPAGGVGLQTILDGPQVPPELRGRTLGQALQLYNGLATAWVRSQGFTTVPAVQQQQQQPPQLPQQQGGNFVPQSRFGPQQPQNSQGFWEEARGIMREEINQALQPIAAQSFSAGMSDAQRTFRATVPDAAIVEGEVLVALQGAPPAVMANPQAWESAADLVRGKMMREGRYNASQATTMQPQGQFGQPNGGAQRYAPAGQVLLPQGAFFSEQPVPGPQFGGGRAGVLTPQQQWAAQLMGMDEQSYMAWQGGIGGQR